MLHESNEEIVERQLLQVYGENNNLPGLPFYVPDIKVFRIIKQIRGAAIYLTSTLVIVLGCIIVSSLMILIFKHAMKLIAKGF